MTPAGVDILKAKVALLPGRPGVYRMLSKTGKVLYVGKAKNLKKRVISYTKYDKLPVRLQRMVSEVNDLIVVETPNEAEAFLLENELIKKYRPYYNILLKDDKSFPYIFMSANHPYPRVTKYRGSRVEKGDYFGPYASASAVNEALAVLQKVFLLRTCTDSMFALRTRPCLLYQIKRCSAPCTGEISEKEYKKLVQQAKDFMNGKSSAIQEKLKERMFAESEKGNYEQALVLRDRIAALNHMQSYADGTTFDQHVDADFIAVYQQADRAAVQVFFFRHGQNGGTHVVFLDDVKDQTEPQLLESFIGQFYQNLPPPHEIIISHELPGQKDIEAALCQKYGHVVRLNAHVKEGRRKILNQALVNAKESLSRHLTETGLQTDMLAELARLMNLPKIEKVEVYDNSHIQGPSAVGAMIAAGPKGFMKNNYRRYNILKSKVGDDFAMMHEVLTRRLTRGAKENDLPDAMLIDGGLGQLSAVKETMDEVGVHVPVMGVAKGPERDAGKEKLYLPGSSEPIILERNSALLFFIQRLRDEAHRFAVGSHRMKRQKASLRATLDEIEGIGAVRRKALIAHFGTPRAVLEASVPELMQVPGISENIAKKIYTFTHK